jgi:hypothetical protein
MRIILKSVSLIHFIESLFFFSQGLVEERTGDYLAEKKKAEALLYQLIPA